MTKKTYKVPTLRIIDIKASEIIACSLTGDINTGGGSGKDNYDDISGYDKDNGGWGIGSPD